MNAEKLIADRIARSGKGGSQKGSISKPIVKIAVTGIALGVAVMLLTVAIVRGFKNEIVGKITGLTADIVVSSIALEAGGDPGPVTIAPDSLDKLASLPGITHVQAVAFKNGLLKSGDEHEGVVLKGVDRNYNFDFLKDHIQSGRLPEFNDSSASREIMVSANLASRLSLKAGDKVQAYFISETEAVDSLTGKRYVRSGQRSRRFTVCGVFKTGFAEYDNQLCIGDIRQVRLINQWPSNAAGSYEVKVRDFSTLARSVEVIQDELGFGYSVSPVTDLFSNIFLWLEKLDINGIIILVLMVGVAIVNMITALLILILERSSMIGLLKAVGMSNISVRRIFLRVSLSLTGRGLLFGNIAGLGLILLQWKFNIVGLDSETYYVDHVAVELSWLYFLLVNLGTFAVCALMLWLPTLIVGRLTPVKTLKWE